MAIDKGETKLALVLDVDDDAVQWVNVLLKTVKLLLLTEVSLNDSSPR
jgi:hypothetical protein